MPQNNFTRLVREIFLSFPVKMPLIISLILISAVINTFPSIFIQKIIALIEFNSLSWPDLRIKIINLLLILFGFYVLSLGATVIIGFLGAEITQGTLLNLRKKMFSKMQKLPLKFFDSQTHGDIMSRYTNDVDSLRQMIAQGIPQLITAVITDFAIVSIMLYFSFWLSILTITGIFVMLKITKKIGRKSSRNFRGQLKNTGIIEGFAEEIIHGQKVVKVFCRENESINEFEKLNLELFTQSEKAHKRANTLGPILNNVGNILYVLTALSGGILIISGVKNLSFSGLPMSISVVIPFLNMTKQLAMSINHLSMQLHSIISGLAGTGRIFAVIDSEVENDNGKIKISRENGSIEISNVSFGYDSEIKILHNINLTAKPGQKTALVGSTGAGKTTIANLIPRFYDVNEGRIFYDGININDITKSSLRKNLGIVLQDTNLFTGTVIENIRYGNLKVTDEDCINAAKLVYAHDFIVRLPEGYETFLVNGGENLSQGERQLISIARAAVANPAVMILDEATSSIDTRTEAHVQKGMDALMKGRTVFVIAHRLSTVRNSDLILVMEHGEIIERGTHEELISQKGRYYKLYTEPLRQS